MEEQTGISTLVAALKSSIDEKRFEEDMFCHDEVIAANLSLLRDYECWQLIDQYLSHVKDEKKYRSEEISKIIFEIYARYRSDISQLIFISKKIIDSGKLSFSHFYANYLDAVWYEEEPKQFQVLEKLTKTFPSIADQIHCLKKMSSLELHSSIEDTIKEKIFYEILELSDSDEYALRKLKQYYSYNEDWNSFIRIAENLCGIEQDLRKEPIAALELAAAYIYKIDQPQKAIEVLDRYCFASHLDTTTLYYDAYNVMRDWDRALNVLKQLIVTADNPQKRAILFYKIAQLYRYKQDQEQYQENLKRCLELNPECFVAWEELIEENLNSKNWPEVRRCLADMSSFVTEEESIKDLQRLVGQIDSVSS